MSGLIVSGTDTGIGKSVASAMLALGLGARYYKPIQSGLEEETDTQFVERMGVEAIPEAYRLTQPLSPHRSAELDDVEIDLDALDPSRHFSDAPLIVEGAGGLLVPVNREILYADVFASWNLPLVLCARTGLGTINHTLMSLEAAESREIQVAGVLFIGEDNPDNRHTICEMGNASDLGLIPPLHDITPQELLLVFKTTAFGAIA